MRRRLGVVVPTLATDAATIRRLLAQWRSVLTEQRLDPRFVVVVQSRRPIDLRIADVDVLVLYTPVCSVSHARNLGLDAIDEDHILFLDDDVKLTSSFAGFVYENIGTHALVAGRLVWNHWLRRRGGVHYTNCVFLNIFAVVFDRKAIRAHGIRFDESFGLGDGVQWPSGEDALFLFHYLTAVGARSFVFNPDAIVDHPPRDLVAESQKIVAYALGQGRSWNHIVAAAPNRLIGLYLRLLFAGTLATTVARIPFQPRLRVQALRNRLVGYLSG